MKFKIEFGYDVDVPNCYFKTPESQIIEASSEEEAKKIADKIAEDIEEQVWDNCSGESPYIAIYVEKLKEVI